MPEEQNELPSWWRVVCESYREAYGEEPPSLEELAAALEARSRRESRAATSIDKAIGREATV